jgi:hypothetical protein
VEYGRVGEWGAEGRYVFMSRDLDSVAFYEIVVFYYDEDVEELGVETVGVESRLVSFQKHNTYNIFT